MHIRMARRRAALLAMMATGLAACDTVPTTPPMPMQAPDRAASIAVASTVGASTYTVPAGVTSLKIVAVGAGGGGSINQPGGAGATVTTTLSVTPGQILDLFVGATSSATTNWSVGGGGSTTISSGGVPLVIAGGGGGAGRDASGGSAGGLNGVGNTGTSGGTVSCGRRCGTAGSGGAGGAGGIGGQGGTSSGGWPAGVKAGDGNGGNGGASGTAGGAGGAGTGVGGVGGYYGGGGGGGYGGGGGGGSGSGGGGGGSLGPDGTTYASANNGGPAGNVGGNGSIEITTIAGATSQVFMSGSDVDTWDAIPELNQPAAYGAAYCTIAPKVGLSANWVNPHKAFVLTGHPWADEAFSAPWINAWNSLGSAGSGSPGPGNYNWTKYHTQVTGNGTFVVRLLADNCSWIYLDGRLVGIQTDDHSHLSYGLTLNGTHNLDFIIFDGGGAAGGKYILETTTNPPPPLDATAPVITPTVTGTPGTDDWYTSNVNVSWSVVDNESAVTTKTGCDALALTANQAEQTYTCTATSSGGTSTSSVKVKIDQTQPTVTGAVTSGTLGANGWYTSDVGVTWTPSAAGPSGQVLAPACSTTSLTSNTSSYTFTCTVTTGAGLSSAPATVTVKRDALSPTISYALTGTLGMNSWYVSDVGVVWTTVAGPSGVGGCTSVPVGTDGVNITFSCSVTAGNGKSASLTTVPAKRDATRPIVTYAATNGGIYTVDQSVSVTCTPSDNLSGIQSSTCTNVSGDAYTFPLGTTSYSATAIDKAGNTSLTTSTSIKVSVTQASLCALVERWVTNKGVANSLCVKLRQGNYAPFRNEVEAQTGKWIPADRAPILLRLVDSL